MHFIAKLIWITSTKRKEQYIQKTLSLMYLSFLYISRTCCSSTSIFFVFSFPKLCLDHSVDAEPVADIDVI